MEKKLKKIYPYTVKFTIISLTIAFFWFTFVFYPKAIKNYQSQSNISTRLTPLVLADSHSLPIDTSAYTISFNKNTDSYGVIVKANDYLSYTVNRNSAKLALKSALSVESLCSFNVTYSPQKGLKIPKSLINEPDSCN
jgi:hypothetical protein